MSSYLNRENGPVNVDAQGNITWLSVKAAGESQFSELKLTGCLDLNSGFTVNQHPEDGSYLLVNGNTVPAVQLRVPPNTTPANNVIGFDGVTDRYSQVCADPGLSIDLKTGIIRNVSGAPLDNLKCSWSVYAKLETNDSDAILEHNVTIGVSLNFVNAPPSDVRYRQNLRMVPGNTYHFGGLIGDLAQLGINDYLVLTLDNECLPRVGASAEAINAASRVVCSDVKFAIKQDAPPGP